MVPRQPLPAQGYYDDDVHYDASKDTKAKEEIAAHKKAVEEERIRQQQQYEAELAYWRSLANQQSTYNPNLGGGDYAAADTYALPGTGSARNVDEYNRRGKYASSSQTGDTTAVDDNFTYTRRIERFHNGDIIADVKDPELVDYYYSSAASQPDIKYISCKFRMEFWGGVRRGMIRGGRHRRIGHGITGPVVVVRLELMVGSVMVMGWGSDGVPDGDLLGDPLGVRHGHGVGGPGWGPGWGGVAWHRGNYTPNGRQSTGIRNGYTGVGSSHPGSPFNSRTNGRAGNVTRQSLGNYARADLHRLRHQTAMSEIIVPVIMRHSIHSVIYTVE